MNQELILRKWLEIDYYYMANKLGFIDKTVVPDHTLILNTIREIDRETTMETSIDTNVVITLLALLWEHTDKKVYCLKDYILKILSRIGYPTSAIIADEYFASEEIQFSPTNSLIDKYILTLQQSRYEVSVGKKAFLLTSFQKELWDALQSKHLVGVSAPTSAGKSFVILISTVAKMLCEPIDIIYIIPSLSLLNQVTEDYNDMLHISNVKNFLITNNLPIGESQADHTVYVWTQEKAISNLSVERFSGLPNKTILVVDEIQNVERITDDTDVRAKILFDVLQELRHAPNVEQIIISGPRIKHIAALGETIFGKEMIEVTTSCSPVLSLTYSIKKIGAHFLFRQYCSLFHDPYDEKIINASHIASYGTSSVTQEYIDYLYSIIKEFSNDQNIIFAPTSSVARTIATSLSEKTENQIENELLELIDYYQMSVHKNYSLCDTLKHGVAYHHGKLPIHVRRTLEKAIRQKKISNIVCTTTLVQGVNLPAQNVIIRNPHLYTRQRRNAAELTSYEMANLRGRAGRLLKDFVGRTIVLDESEFEETEGYDQQSLFEDVPKDISPSYKDNFEKYRDSIILAVEKDDLVTQDMYGYGYLVTYIRQSVLRYGESARNRMSETGVTLTQKQVAAIILKLERLSVPRSICLQNRYWDPFVLNDIFCNFRGRVPSCPTERGAQKHLSNILKFLRDTESTSYMYERHIPNQYRQGKGRSLLCATCIKWSSETPLSEILSGDYYEGPEAAEHIERMIQLLQETVSFNVPLLIKPIVEMCNENSSIVACLQSGAYNASTRKMIEIGIPRELAIRLSNSFSFDTVTGISNYDYEIFIRDRIKGLLEDLPYWEKVQLDFLK